MSRAKDDWSDWSRKINDLRRRDAELEQLSNTQDHIQFLAGNTDLEEQHHSGLEQILQGNTDLEEQIIVDLSRSCR